ncbi:arf-GAP with SH3 ANK repeat and PH domain-containing 2, partial [Brachionus plicatilis]
IAKIVGNDKLNSIFEESLDKSQKLKSNSTMDLRQKYLKSKYEHHLFARQQFGDEALGLFVENLHFNNLPNSIDFLLKIFVNNIDMFKPVPKDSKLRNILLLILEHFDEFITLPITEFLVQNRDFPKNENKIDYQDIDGNSAVHYCALYNRIDSIKLLLKSNANVRLKNKAGLTALQIADNSTNFECAEQISLFVQGKPLAKIDWMVWFEKETEEYTENGKLESAVIDKTTNDRPLSLIIGSNKNIGCSKTKKLHYNRHHSESFNVVNIEKYYNQKRAKNLSILPPVPFEKIKCNEYEHRSMDNLDKSCYLNQNEVARKTSKKNNNRYTAIIDCVSFESIDTEVAKQSNESRLSEEKLNSKL